MIACFVGSEAAILHGMKHALTQTLDVVPVTTEELDEVVKYQREHGFKLAWIAPDMRAHKELWESMTRQQISVGMPFKDSGSALRTKNKKNKI